jgi:demethylmenaquinone methyltransferase/2-methoxy-6-polyprenyl-1,4-benzoquinol methylase
MGDSITEVDEKIAQQGPQRFVNSVFSRVARRYDIMNDLMSGGVHRLWKDAAINWLAPSRSRPSTLIDVAGGTGDLAARFLKAAAPGSKAVLCDISAEMIEQGRARFAREIDEGRASIVQGNAEKLPLKDAMADFYVIAFGIRNVPSIPSALSEAYRVLKPGGRFLCLEFSRVEMPFLDELYRRYSDAVVPALGRVVAGDAEPYRYLVESIRKFPDQRRFSQMIEDAGFLRVQFRNLSGGIAAMHSGIKP